MTDTSTPSAVAAAPASSLTSSPKNTTAQTMVAAGIVAGLGYRPGRQGFNRCEGAMPGQRRPRLPQWRADRQLCHPGRQTRSSAGFNASDISELLQ